MSREDVEMVEGVFAGAASMDKQTLLAALPDRKVVRVDYDNNRKQAFNSVGRK